MSLRKTLMAPLLRFASKLRFPQLVGLVAALFVLNIVVPDPLPFMDELLLGLLTILLAGIRKEEPPSGEPSGKPPEKNVTPPGQGPVAGDS